jgi:hypothetical protein
MEEPYYLTLNQIGKLTDTQIVGLYGRERDKDGKPKPVGPERPRGYTTPEEAETAFMNMVMAFGYTPDAAKAAWDKSREK